MVWEFPAVSQSRVEFWKEPQFTKGGMWWFTLFFGFFGLHHLYLRSPQTALIFLIVNSITLGFPWFYDLIQLSSDSGESIESLNKHGLNNFFYPLGVAQGMWKEGSLMNSFSKMTGLATPAPLAPAIAPLNSAPAPSAPSAPAPSAPTPSAPAPSAPAPLNSAPQDPQDPAPANGPLLQKGGGMDGPPNPTWFLLYALLIPIAPLAQLIAGDTNNSVSRFLDLTIIPLGFLFYWCAFMYDYFILLLYPADLFVAGSKRFFPFTYLGMDIEGHSERLTGISEIKPCPADGFIMTMFRIALPILSVVSPGLAQSITAALNSAQKTKEVVIDQGLEKINKATRIARQASELTTTVGSLAAMPQVPQVQLPQVPQRLPVMVGGGQPFSPLDYAALGSLGAVIAGGFILSLNRRQNDPPPNPGRV